MRFPGLGAGVELIQAACPLDAGQRRQLADSGFVLPASLAGASRSRIEEFEAGRYCAWQALLRLGGGGGPALGVAEDRSARWPAGFVGSIAHGHGMAVAAAARAAEVRSVGIDAEPVMEASRALAVKARILTPAEHTALLGNEAEWVTLVFSAKEAIYKCLRPLCGAFFGFEAAAVLSVDLAQGTFAFGLREAIGGEFGAGWTGEGRFALGEGWVFAAVLLRS